MAILIDHRKIPRFRIVKRLHDLIHRRVDYDLGRGGNHELRYMETIIQLRTEYPATRPARPQQGRCYARFGK